jgi:hypothetical protein
MCVPDEPRACRRGDLDVRVGTIALLARQVHNGAPRSAVHGGPKPEPRDHGGVGAVETGLVIGVVHLDRFQIDQVTEVNVSHSPTTRLATQKVRGLVGDKESCRGRTTR